jgi:serine-type D-Ala-D-Ala carboxypeptidase (penicillin-binding protein 5/6)
LTFGWPRPTPSESVVRTFVYSSICLLITFAPLHEAEAAAPAVSCTACAVVDEDGELIWGRDVHARLPNASTTKMVTAILVRETVDLEEQVTVSETAGSLGAGYVDLTAGETYTVGELLQALLMASSNEAAVALAEHVAGSEETFVASMNARAEELGATDTHFVTAHGLDTPGHYSSPADLIVFGRALMDDPELARIVRTPVESLQGSGGSQPLENTNDLLESYPGALGIKTGMTAGAGDVLVSAARRQGRVVYAAALGSTDAAADSRALLDFGFRRTKPEPVDTEIVEVVRSVTGPLRALAGAIGASLVTT